MQKKEALFYDFRIGPEDTNLLDMQPNIPQQLADGGVFICLRGEGEFFLGLKGYRLKAGDMCVVFPAAILQTVRKSDDFEGFGVAVALEVYEDIQLPSSLDYFIYIKNNPCISLTPEEQDSMMEICRLLIRKYNCVNHLFRQEITKSLFRVLYCEIAAIYKKSTPIAEETVSRKEMLVRKFMYMLGRQSAAHREVEYYARKLCVTPRYLSSVIKEKTGGSALFWINGLVIWQAKSLLHDKSLSVMQIADELNFPNPSFFGQFFKKYTGMTPKGFRDREVIQ